MKVISISTDRKLFDKESAVLLRSIEYASKIEELHVVVFSLKKLGLKPEIIGNLHIYPTNSITHLCYISNAIKLGKKIILGNKFMVGRSVISTQDPFETGLVGFCLKKKFKFPLQLQSHTNFFSLEFKKSFLNKIRLIIIKFIISYADGFRVVNESVAKKIKENFPSLKITPEVLPIFVDVEKIINTIPSKNIKLDFPKFKFVIFMASRITPEKKVKIAIRALSKIVSEFSHTGLVIAGEGEERVNLESLARKLGVTDNVVFVGWQNDLISYYKTADLFLLTSEYEGYGMTLIEAGASGCPIVTTRVGIADTSLFVNDKNSFVCPVGDVNCIFNAISKLIHDNAKRELFKQEMQDSIKRTMISKEEYTARYVGLLENLIKIKV